MKINPPHISVIHGPNLNLLGQREVDIYGSVSFENINDQIREWCKQKNVEVSIFQSNGEGDIIDHLHSLRGKCDGIVINPAAYTHTSVAIRDAIAAVEIPAVEVHLSNIHCREEFRRVSFTAPVCIGQVSGFGAYSYIAGLGALLNYFATGTGAQK